jgi:hypothetical protein
MQECPKIMASCGPHFLTKADQIRNTVMSRKHRRKKSSSPGPARVEHSNPPAHGTTIGSGAAAATARQLTGAPQTAASVVDAEMAEVHRLMAEGACKAALDIAKQLHKRLGTQASEALVVDAYAARLGSLADRKLWVEAAELLQIVQQRYPQARDRLREIQLKLSVHSGTLEELLRPLNETNLPSDRRNLIETAVRQDVDDLEALARCSALPENHPLRKSAGALLQVFDAVTRRAVSDSELELPEVSYRSPLVAWKLLVRALACLYRRDQEGCERWLSAIDPESVPARLSRVLRAIQSGSPEGGFTPAEARLFAQVTSHRGELRRALESLDLAFTEDHSNAIYKMMRMAVASCQAACPEILEKLKQEIAIRSALSYLSSKDVFRAIGGRPQPDARSLRLFAVALEKSGDPYHLFEACQLWDVFRERAVAEGWFPPTGPEAAVVELHRAELLAHVENYPHVAAELRARIFDCGQSGNASDLEGLASYTPEQLYRRACMMDPHREAFEAWLDWARKQADWRRADAAARAWCQALPRDFRPWLLLMDSAEKRGAFQKALVFLERAESLEGINTEVRRARLRLLVASAIRHLKLRKTHLVEQDLQQIESLPESREGDRPAFWRALRWSCCELRGDEGEAASHFEQLSSLLEGEIAGAIVLTGLRRACNLPIDKVLERRVPPMPKPGNISLAVARALALGTNMNLSFTIPQSLQGPIEQELLQWSSTFSIGQLLILGQSAADSSDLRLAYAASVPGLARAGATEGRFLLLRARSLPAFEEARRNICLAAAAELARRQRDTRLLDEIIEVRRRRRTAWDEPLGEENLSMSSGQLERLLEEERKARTYPDRPLRRTVLPGDYDGLPGLCQCPKCRASRGELDEGAGFEDLDDGESALFEVLESVASKLPGSRIPVKDLFRSLGLDAWSKENTRGRSRKAEPKSSVAAKKSRPIPPEQGELF